MPEDNWIFVDQNLARHSSELTDIYMCFFYKDFYKYEM
jgi:hypothetical protein